MSPLALADVVKSVRDLPSLPVVVLEVLQTFDHADVNTGLLAEKVSKDQALAAKTLRLANSSFYGLQRKVATIQQAITVLGFDSVRALITAAAITDAFANTQAGYWDSKAFWRHAVGTAMCARMIARYKNLNQDIAFVSGLLHDIGKLVMVARFPEVYMKVARYRGEQDCHWLDAERTVLEFDHCQVGRALAERWRFPASVQRAIAGHHAPVGQDLGDIAAVVHVANALCHALDLSADEFDMVPPVSQAAWDSLGLVPEAIVRICRDAEREFEEASQVLVR